MTTRLGLGLGLVLLAGCSSAPSAPTVSPPAVPHTAVVALEQAAGTKHVSNVVATANGYEAASWALGKAKIVGAKRFRHKVTPTGPIYFWRAPAPAGPWAKVGSSTYPAYASSPYPCPPQITAGVVAGGSDAVFIVRACITGDGVLNVVAYATGPHGWGLLQVVGRDAMASFGRPAALKGGFLSPPTEARFDMKFAGDRLETVDGTGMLSDAGNGLFPRLTWWRWTGERLVATSTTAFVARPAAAPDFHARPLPAGRCPTTGTYSASFALHKDFGGPPGHGMPNAPVRLASFPPSERFPATFSCDQRLPALQPMTVELARSTKPDSTRAPLTNRRWMTAPLWMLIIPFEGFSLPHRIPIPVGPRAQRTLPYVVSPSYGVNEVVGQLGDTVPGPNFRKNIGRPARPCVGTVTLRAGRIVGVGLRP